MGPNCANFIAGIIEGILEASKFNCKCMAHYVAEEDENDADPYNQEQQDNVYDRDENRGKKRFTTLYIIKFQ